MPRNRWLGLALVCCLLALVVLALVVLASPAAAQDDAFVSRVVLTNGGGLDSGASLPGTCAIGNLFVVTSTGVLSSCTATNTWTAVASGGSVPSGASLPGTCTVGQLFVLTTTGVASTCTATNTWTAIASSGGASLSVPNSWSALQTFAAGAAFTNTYYSPLVADGNSGTTKTIDLSIGNEHYLTLTGNVTLTLSNPTDGGRYVLLFNTGAGSFTVTWPGTVAWAGGTAPTITATASKVDLCTFQYVATLTKYFAACNQAY